MKTIIEKRMCARMDLLNPFVATVMPAMIAIKETITLNTAPKKRVSRTFHRYNLS